LTAPIQLSISKASFITAIVVYTPLCGRLTESIFESPGEYAQLRETDQLGNIAERHVGFPEVMQRKIKPDVFTQT